MKTNISLGRQGWTAIRVRLAVVALLATCPAGVRANIIYSDGTFDNGDWLHVLAVNGDIATATVSSDQEATGGNPDAYRRVDITSSLSTRSFHAFAEAIYEPGAPIESIDASFDYTGLSAGNMNLLLALRQGDVIYATPTIFFSWNTQQVGEDKWQLASFTGLTASDFVERIDGTTYVTGGTDNPDFTSGPLQFGFLVQRGGTGTRSVGIDNFNVEVIIPIIPEPASATLLLLGGLALVRRRRTGR